VFVACEKFITNRKLVRSTIPICLYIKGGLQYHNPGIFDRSSWPVFSAGLTELTKNAINRPAKIREIGAR